VAAIAARALTGLMPPREPRFKPNPRAVERARAWLTEVGWKGGPVLALAFGAAHPIRRWSNAKVTATLARLSEGIGACVVIEDGAPGDERPIRTPANVPTAVWRGRLPELKGLLAAADITFCADSGPMHIAAAVGSRTVALFGPGDIEWFGPPGSRHRVVAAEPMPCRPCYDYCIYPTPVCMERIGIAEAAEALGRGLAEVARAR
jgi:ADP-heptose:LPS heptosyltransferase